MFQPPSPLVEKVGPLLGRVGTEILNDATQRALPLRDRGELALASFKAELVAFTYATLGLIIVSQKTGSSLGRAIRDEWGPLDSVPKRESARLIAGALRVAERGVPESGIPPHGGIFDSALFSSVLDPETGKARVSDALFSEFFSALWALSEGPAQSGSSRKFLGELYEAILELEPELIQNQKDVIFRLSTDAREHARRRFGSYYTPERLIEEVLDGALNPLIARAVALGGKDATNALLELRVIDPACGSGDFLRGATWRIAKALTELDGETEAGPQQNFATVLERCIFGIDIDPLAREICRLGLWLEVSETKSGLTPSSIPIRLGNAIAIPPEADDPSSKASGRSALRYFDWNQEFPEVMERGGFDAILGNPPWIAHAGRAAQSLPEDLKAYYKRHAEPFSGYPTTHGIFAGVLPRMLRPRGRLGLVLPASVSELKGYTATRRAHDRYNTFTEELIDFGEGQFPGVTQPCMALISERSPRGRGAEAGTPWPVARTDLNLDEKSLLEKLLSFAPLPPELFGERGLQSDRSLLHHLEKTPVPTGRFTMPIREGTDVREFTLLAPRFHADPIALGARLRSESEFQSVRVLVRQTARYPIAALSDGLAFRNSLLAGFEVPSWPASALVALLNSSFIRWAHFQRFRDARQPILPQVKIGHLRRLPMPARALSGALSDLSGFGVPMGKGRAPSRSDLDELVFELYELTAGERNIIRLWRDRVIVPPDPRERSSP